MKALSRWQLVTTHFLFRMVCFIKLVKLLMLVGAKPKHTCKTLAVQRFGLLKSQPISSRLASEVRASWPESVSAPINKAKTEFN